MREELLAIVEKNSRIDTKELAVLLGVEEIDIINEKLDFTMSAEHLLVIERNIVAQCAAGIEMFATFGNVEMVRWSICA